METLARSAASINGNGPEYYFDRVQSWHGVRLTRTQRYKLNSLCQGGLHVRDRAMPYGPQWLMRLQARQPSPAYFTALVEMTQGQRVLINYLEITRDECHQSNRLLQEHYDFRCDHEFRNHHNKHAEGRQYGTNAGTAYDARRRSGRLLVRYMESHCRITGELDCLHTEFKISRAENVRRVGVCTIQDLINFDHAQWWRSKTSVATVDIEQLGRMLRNKRDDTRAREALIEVWQGRQINVDRKVGHVIKSGYRSVQHLIDHCRGWLRVERCLQSCDQVGPQSSWQTSWQRW